MLRRRCTTFCPFVTDIWASRGPQASGYNSYVIDTYQIYVYIYPYVCIYITTFSPCFSLLVRCFISRSASLRPKGMEFASREKRV